jgi:hypothetical protein
VRDGNSELLFWPGIAREPEIYIIDAVGQFGQDQVPRRSGTVNPVAHPYKKWLTGFRLDIGEKNLLGKCLAAKQEHQQGKYGLLHISGIVVSKITLIPATMGQWPPTSC